MRIRPGAQRLRNCLGTVVTLLSTAACAPAPDQAVHTVDYYREHREAREAMLAACNRDPGRLERTPNCINARAATRKEGIGSLRDLPPMGLAEPEKDAEK